MCFLYFMETCKRLKCSALEFFEMAYVDTFKKFPPNLGDDYAQYLLHSVIPPYAIKYLDKIKANEGNVDDAHKQIDLPLSHASER